MHASAQNAFFAEADKSETCESRVLPICFGNHSILYYSTILDQFITFSPLIYFSSSSIIFLFPFLIFVRVLLKPNLPELYGSPIYQNKVTNSKNIIRLNTITIFISKIKMQRKEFSRRVSKSSSSSKHYNHHQRCYGELTVKISLALFYIGYK